MKTCYGELPIKEKNGRAKLVRSGVPADTHDQSETERRLSYPQGASQLAAGPGRATTKSGSNPASAPQYRSNLEAAYATYLEGLKCAGEIKNWWYEPPFRFLLPGSRNTYQADFLVQRIVLRVGATSLIEIHEVKGWSKNRREGITKVKTAAGLNLWAHFVLVTRKQRQWVEELL